MTVRTAAVVVTVILALVGGVGCGDPLADKLEASGQQPYDDEEAARDEAARQEEAARDAAARATTTTTAEAPDVSAARTLYLAAINQICEDGIDELSGSFPSAPEDVVPYFEQMLAASQAMLDQARALTPPPGDELVVNHLFTEHQAVVDQMRTALAAGRMGTIEGMRAVTAEVQPRSDALDEAYRDYGLTSCA